MKRLLQTGMGVVCLSLTLVAVRAATRDHATGTAESGPVLVELFTSEGCSSCPPADRLLSQLQNATAANGARIIVLSEHVTYWDQLGWRDRFSSSAVTERQSAYGDHFHLDSVYTPQMVVNGRAQMVGSDAAAVRRALSAPSPSGRLHIAAIVPTSGGISVRLAVSGIAPGSADLYAVVAQDMASTPVERGENAGHTLNHVSVARSLSRLSPVGGDQEVTVQIPAAALESSRGVKRHLIVFAQSQGTGPVVAADSAPLS